MVVESLKIEIDKAGLLELRELVERLVAAVEKSAEIAERSTRSNQYLVDTVVAF